MAERIKTPSLITLTPSVASELILVIPTGIKRWTLIVTPVNVAASPNPVTLDIDYDTGGGVFYPRNPPGSVTAMTINQANVITSEDVVNRIKLTITPGATVPDAGVKVVLNGER